LRSSGQRIRCAPRQNAELYRATIGGLGLTGLILWAELQLKPISSPFMTMERIRFFGLDEFFDLVGASERDYEYRIAWVDTLTTTQPARRGIFIRGNHAEGDSAALLRHAKAQTLRVPSGLPAVILNRFTMKMVNTAYYLAQWRRAVQRTVHYDLFLYPQDLWHPSNRVYGRRGVLAYQCVVPYRNARQAIAEILRRLSRRGRESWQTTLKVFGARASPGMLSFPRPGVTLAYGFPQRGTPTWRLLDELDEVVREASGALYPAKDARMSSETFRASFPAWREFSSYIDARFSSSFWRRVAAQREDHP
jgi:FAD/FMN-containing dehydrogenase